MKTLALIDTRSEVSGISLGILGMRQSNRATHLAEGAEFVLKILFGIRDGVLLSLPRLCDLFCKNCGQS